MAGALRCAGRPPTPVCQKWQFPFENNRHLGDEPVAKHIGFRRVARQCILTTGGISRFHIDGFLGPSDSVEGNGHVGQG